MQHRRRSFILKLAAVELAVWPGRAWAHASEQGFVLLLPTDLYTGAGVVAVALTLAALLVVPRRAALAMFKPVAVPRLRRSGVIVASSCLSALLLFTLIGVGLVGPRDPLANPLPLTVWTVFWLAIVTLQGTLGNVWVYLNPISGPLAVLRRLRRWRYAKLPKGIGSWPAVLGFLAFSYVLLADPAPADPARLARLAGMYWSLSFALTLTFGPRWLVQGEVFTVLMRAYGRVAVFAAGRAGVSGWRGVRSKTSTSVAVLSVFLLATGSFDGLNETFWWLGRLGINPFEFPGRSALILESTLGLLAANILLLGVFVSVLLLGRFFAGASNAPLLRLYAPTLIPIALGYHVAHYLPSFMVDSQYALVALSDPLLNGSDLLGLGEFYVSTGFFNTQDSVRRIYLTQASAIVAGHVIAVLSAHAVALRQYKTHRAAVLSQAPLAVFMVAYTWFGLWLLASPRF